MRFLFKIISRDKTRRPRKKKTPAKAPGAIDHGDGGYNPYDTLPGVEREELTLRRREGNDWSF